jgi:glycine cleavage system aminomethyltransferase T
MMAPVAGPVRRSPAAREHERLGATMEIEAGWDLPMTYGDDGAERSAVRTSVAIADITARGKVDVRGEIDPALAAAGGEVIGRIAPHWAMAFTPPGGEEILLPKLEAAAGPRSMVTDATHLFAGYALCGPMLPDLLARTSGWNPATLRPGGATGAPIADVRSVMVRRDLEVPVLEVYVATELARYVWDTLAEVVSSLDGRTVGWRALRAEGWS